jgi:hypothetical protein
MLYLLKPIHAANRLLSNLLFEVHVPAWNALPAALCSSTSLPSFKHSLIQIDLAKFLIHWPDQLVKFNLVFLLFFFFTILLYSLFPF